MRRWGHRVSQGQGTGQGRGLGRVRGLGQGRSVGQGHSTGQGRGIGQGRSGWRVRWSPSLVRRLASQGAGDRGTATAEYAIVTLAACGFAALMVTILRSSEVHALLFGLIRRALSVG